ncbi:MAG: zinc-dependent alcohol dehydrogenase family protein [Anaerolineales bacterium]|nr:zinc-dependent alcohol dehydrogenase family protein [Anaerolineales bacterium]
MKAIVYSAPGAFEYTDVPDPKPADDEVLIRVKACGLCRTDMHIHSGRFLSEFPLIPGHEISGEIAKMGVNVKGFQVGDRVVADNTELCGYCHFCREDKPLYCENFVSHGCNCAGGFAEYVSIKAEKTFKVRNVSFKEGVMVEPVACAVHGMDVIALTPGSEVLLFGAGPTGLVLAQLLKQNGAVSLVTAAPPGVKLDLAAEIADTVIPIDKQDYSQHRKEILDRFPNGFDTIVEATGAPQLFEETVHYAAMGAQIIAYGVYPEDKEIRIKPYDIFKRELTIKGSFAQTHCFGRAVKYLENGRIQVSKLVTHEIPLADYAGALELMRQSKAIKIAMIP